MNDDFPKNMNLALRLLSRRAHSVSELKRKLLSRGIPRTTCEKVIGECCRLNLLDDELLAKDYHAELAARNCGTFKMKAALRKKGIDDAIIETTLEHDPEDEIDRARAALAAKLKLLTRETDIRKKREKAYRFLVSRGFSGENIRTVIEESHELSPH